MSELSIKDQILDGFKAQVEVISTMPRDGYVLGWAETNLCVRYADPELKTCNATGVQNATVFTAEQVKARIVVPEVRNGKGERAMLLLRAAVIDKTLADLEKSIEMIETGVAA